MSTLINTIRTMLYLQQKGLLVGIKEIEGRAFSRDIQLHVAGDKPIIVIKAKTSEGNTLVKISHTHQYEVERIDNLPGVRYRTASLHATVNEVMNHLESILNVNAPNIDLRIKQWVIGNFNASSIECKGATKLIRGDDIYDKVEFEVAVHTHTLDITFVLDAHNDSRIHVHIRRADGFFIVIGVALKKGVIITRGYESNVLEMDVVKTFHKTIGHALDAHSIAGELPATQETIPSMDQPAETPVDIEDLRDYLIGLQRYREQLASECKQKLYGVQPIAEDQTVDELIQFAKQLAHEIATLKNLKHQSEVITNAHLKELREVMAMVPEVPFIVSE